MPDKAGTMPALPEGARDTNLCQISAPMAASKRTLVIIAFAALYVIWGSTYLGIRFAIETIPPFLMAGGRFVLAGLIMYVIAWSQGISKSSWANWRTSLIIGACLLLAGNGGVTISEKYIDSGLAALIVAIVPIYIVLLGWATGMAPRPTPIVWVGLIAGFIGVGVLFGPALRFSSNDGRHPAIGMSILLVSSFIWSVGSLYSRVARHAASPFLTAAQQMLCGGMLLLFVAHIIHLSGDHWRCGWIHGLHLAAASLRTGQSRHLCVRESDCRSPVGRSFCRRNCNHAHVDCCRSHYWFRCARNHGAATKSEDRATCKCGIRAG